MPASSLIHVYLSPHLDDAVLSCGGMIHRQTQAGERVVVVTVCAGDPPPGPLSALAQTLHERWQTPPGEAVAARRAEDLAALSVLGAQAVHLDVLDCIYRTDPETGRHLYGAETSLFGNVHPSEPTLVRRIATQISALLSGFGRRHFHVPLGLAHHVDHQVTRQAAEMAQGVYAYFEDYPYAAREVVAPTPLLAGTPATPGATPPPGRVFSPELVLLSTTNLDAKVRAIAQYVSQISTFWADEAVMAADVRRFAERVGAGNPAERIWRTG